MTSAIIKKIINDQNKDRHMQEHILPKGLEKGYKPGENAIIAYEKEYNKRVTKYLLKIVSKPNGE